MKEIKNILIIGKIGSGKTTLTNVLSGTDEFKEDCSSSAEIWRTKPKEFEDDNGKIYRIIDTVGLGGATLNKEGLLEKFEEEISNYIDEGISQIFFVIEDRRIPEEVLTEFLWLNEFLFDKKVFDYTTIVRNNFSNFKSKKKCEKTTKELTDNLTNFFDKIDKKEIYEEINEKILQKEKVIYVNNPPINIKDKEELEDNKGQRQKSRVILSDYLNKFSDEKPYKPDIRKWLDEEHPEGQRAEKTILDISKRELKGTLRLKGFTKLERLNCSNNQLTNLDLSDCPKLVELRCHNNKFSNLNFLKLAGRLEQLNISNCPLKGSLKPLVNLDKLEALFITNTNFSKGLEYLPESCKKLVCNSDQQYKSTKIAEELDKIDCLVKGGYGINYYNLDKWRETDKQNKLTASVIPLERLFVIKSNIKKFINRWGTKKTDADNNSDHWYDSYIRWFFSKLQRHETESNVSELSKLQDPKEFSVYWYIGGGVQWTSRATAVGGGILAATVNPVAGGVLAAVSPLVEIGSSQMKKRLYDVKEKKWEEFAQDSEELLDNYHELLGILEKIEISKLGEVNIALKKLDEVTDLFLENYDKDKNGTVDISELIAKRNNLAEDLTRENLEGGGSQLGNIVEAMRKLENEIVKYRQGANDKENIEEKSKTKRQAKELEIVVIDNQVDEIQETHIQVPPK